MASKTPHPGAAEQSRIEIPESAIKVAAYFIWEKEGRPDGEDLRHWYLAIDELSSSRAAPQSATPARRAKVTNIRKSSSGKTSRK